MARNHHYVPRCYQKGFIDPSPNPKYPEDKEPRIWQAELKSRRIRLRPTRKVGCSPGFYALGSEADDVNEAAEQAHGELESAVAPTLLRLNRGEYQIEAQEWEDLLIFGATMALRGPSTRNTLEGVRRQTHRIYLGMLADLPGDQFLRQLQRTYPDKTFSPDEVRKLQEWARNNEDYRFQIEPYKWIRTSLKTALNTVYPLFSKMQWIFLHAPAERPFICSDQPVNWVDPTIPRNSRRGHGLEARNIEVSFPIGRSLALMGHWGHAPRHMSMTAELVDQFNLRSVECARIEILGPTHESVERGLAMHYPSACTEDRTSSQ